MSEMLDNICREAAALSWIDWAATVTALVYVVLAARQYIWCWFWGMVSCSLWAYASFAFYQLYLDALLQVFYVVMSAIGLYQWKYGGSGGGEAKIRRLSGEQHLFVLLAGGLLAYLFGYAFEQYTPAAATYWDATTTVFSVFATLMLVQKVLDNWLYWIVVDALYVWLYVSRGAWLFALLMVVYTVIALLALLSWWKAYQADVNNGNVGEQNSAS